MTSAGLDVGGGLVGLCLGLVGLGLEGLRGADGAGGKAVVDIGCLNLEGLVGLVLGLNVEETGGGTKLSSISSI